MLLFKDSFVAQYPETVSCFPHKKKIPNRIYINPSFKGNKNAAAQSRKDSFPFSVRQRNSRSSKTRNSRDVLQLLHLPLQPIIALAAPCSLELCHSWPPVLYITLKPTHWGIAHQCQMKDILSGFIHPTSTGFSQRQLEDHIPPGIHHSTSHCSSPAEECT